MSAASLNPNSPSRVMYLRLVVAVGARHVRCPPISRLPSKPPHTPSNTHARFLGSEAPVADEYSTLASGSCSCLAAKKGVQVAARSSGLGSEAARAHDRQGCRCSRASQQLSPHTCACQSAPGQRSATPPHLYLHHRPGRLRGLRPLVGQQILGLVALPRGEKGRGRRRHGPAGGNAARHARPVRAIGHSGQRQLREAKRHTQEQPRVPRQTPAAAARWSPSASAQSAPGGCWLAPCTRQAAGGSGTQDAVGSTPDA